MVNNNALGIPSGATVSVQQLPDDVSKLLSYRKNKEDFWAFPVLSRAFDKQNVSLTSITFFNYFVDCIIRMHAIVL